MNKHYVIISYIIYFIMAMVWCDAEKWCWI